VERQDVGGVECVGCAGVRGRWIALMRYGLSRLFCCLLRRGRENNRVGRQDVGTLKCVGVSVMQVHAGEVISVA
jgi:hypothetical protein